MKIEKSHIDFHYSKNSDFRLKIDSFLYDFDGILGIFGLSGSGKSTFGQILAGLITNDNMEINFQPENPFVLYSSQVAENIFLGSTIRMTMDFILYNNSHVENLDAKCSKYLDTFNLDFEKLVNKQGNELSAGELRKFALSLALSCEPDLLVLDEPTIGLDLPSKILFNRVIAEYEGKLIVISHDFEVLSEICEEILVIHEGSLIFQGKTESVEKDDDLCAKVGLNFYKIRREKRKEIYNKLMHS